MKFTSVGVILIGLIIIGIVVLRLRDTSGAMKLDDLELGVKESTINNELQSISMVIDDSVIDAGDPFKVIEPLWWNCNIYDGESNYYDSIESFSIEQVQVFAIMWYESEVNNGGHDQFYFNSTGVVWEEAFEGLKNLGLESYVTIIQSSINKFGDDGPSKDRFIRQEQMDSMEVEFDELDTSFYHNNVNLNDALQEFIEQNREAFYFSGDVYKPNY